MERKKDKTNQQNIRETRGTTVLLEMEYTDQDYSARGSGFFVAPDKIVTNVHVLADAATVTAKCVDPEIFYTIEGIIAFDDINDLAILKIVEEDTPFSIGPDDTVREGDLVLAVGYPEGKEASVEGTVHSIRNSGQHLHLKCRFSPGYSGGPVLNTKGEVVAVAEAGGISFDNSAPNEGKAISADVLKLLLRDVGEVEPLDVWQKRPRICAYAEACKGNDKREQSEYKEAMVRYDTALKLNPNLADVYNNRAAAKISMGKYDEAYADSLTALRINPERFNFSGLGVYLSWKSEVIKIFSIGLVVKFIKNIFGKGTWFAIQGYGKLHLAKARAEQRHIEEARNLYRAGIDNFSEAINRKPKVAKCYNNRGWAKYLFAQFETEQGTTAEAQKLYQEAISDVNEALRLKPKGAKFRSASYHTRGAAKAGLGDHNGAIEDFDASIQLNPKKALYYHDRGLAKEALGQQEAAKADCAKAKEIDPDFEK